MAGIYIHIPFCYQRCFYCDFYSITDLGKREKFVESLLDELSVRKDFISDRIIDTIYFGGGTPSLLNCISIEYIIGRIESLFELSSDPEITLEANPDDLNRYYLRDLKKTRVNRLSIGIQSFDDRDLVRLNRRHNSKEALESVENALEFGFDNLSIDLIFGLPEQNNDSWSENLEIAAGLPVEHISAYNLTYEKGTAFYRWLKEGKLKEAEDSTSFEMFQTARFILGNEGFEQYEISNFARNSNYSRHNTKYWFGEQYLGLGPSAHSYNGECRQWNISDLQKWMDRGENQDKILRTEFIDQKTRRNEIVMTRLRTKWGISEEEYTETFGIESWKELLAMAAGFFAEGLMFFERGRLTISRKGLFLSDGIIAQLFVV